MIKFIITSTLYEYKEGKIAIIFSDIIKFIFILICK